jgi:hypothetical protein
MRALWGGECRDHSDRHLAVCVVQQFSALQLPLPKLTRSHLNKVDRTCGVRVRWQIGEGTVGGGRVAHWMLAEESFGPKRAESLLNHFGLRASRYHPDVP